MEQPGSGLGPGAVLILRGRGVVQSSAEATCWLKKAANQGDLQAKKLLDLILDKSVCS